MSLLGNEAHLSSKITEGRCYANTTRPPPQLFFFSFRLWTKQDELVDIDATAGWLYANGPKQ